MKKSQNFLVIGIFLVLAFSLIFAADFTPQGNINLRDIYNITGVPEYNGTDMNLTGWIFSQGYNLTNAYLYVTNGTFVSSATNIFDQILNTTSNVIFNDLSISGNAIFNGELNISSLTLGSILFSGANGIITQNNANFFWNNTGNNLVLGGTNSLATISGVVRDSIFSTHSQGGSNAYDLIFHRHSATSGTFLAGARSRGSEASPLIIQNGDNLLDIFGIGYDGTDYEFASSIMFDVDDIPGNNDMPGRIVFLTTLDNTTGLIERMRINNAGKIGINTTSSQNTLNIIGDLNATKSIFSQEYNLTNAFLYATNGTYTIWAEIINGTMATWAQVLNGTVMVWADAVNGTLADNTTIAAYIDSQDTSFNDSITIYTNENFVNITGDIMTGNLTINANLTVDSPTFFIDSVNNYVGFGSIVTNTNNQIHFIMDAAKDILIDGTTNPRTIDTGVIRFEQTPAIDSTRAITLNIDNNGREDTHGIVINFLADGMSETATIYDTNIITTGAIGGVIRVFEISSVGNGAIEVHGIHVDPGIDPLSQFSGTFGAIESAWNQTDEVTSFLSTSASNATLFSADNDILYIGMAITFDEVEVILNTDASGAGIVPVFEVSDGASGWIVFNPNDDTRGFRDSGIISWIDNPAGWATDTVNGVSNKYWFRITRTANALTTPPIEDKILVASSTLYQWDEFGGFNIKNITASNEITASNFKGIFNWTEDSPYLSFDGVTLSWLDNIFNSTYDIRYYTQAIANSTFMKWSEAVNGTLWKADSDISADEISESKIAFSTACAAGNHYYLNGNDLACESDDDTTYSAGIGLNLTGTTFAHNDSSSQADSDNSGQTFIQDILLDGYGHIISLVATATTGITWANAINGTLMIWSEAVNGTLYTQSEWDTNYTANNANWLADTQADDVCSGTTTYLDGEGNCDDISSVYEVQLNNEAGLYAVLSDVSNFLQNLVEDTTPQLGGYLDTNSQNIGSTSDEIENIYVSTDSRIYFGDGQEASIHYNGTALIITG